MATRFQTLIAPTHKVRLTSSVSEEVLTRLLVDPIRNMGL
jgi:hypothetical protein